MSYSEAAQHFISAAFTLLNTEKSSICTKEVPLHGNFILRLERTGLMLIDNDRTSRERIISHSYNKISNGKSRVGRMLDKYLDALNDKNQSE